MKLEVGMYLRFEGMVNKILEIEDDYIIFDMNWYDHWASEISSMKIDRFINDYKPKVSFNIIDLIEVGDILVDMTNDKLEVLLIDNELMVKNTGLIYDNNYYLPIKNITIKEIVTKEQFESISYHI